MSRAVAKVIVTAMLGSSHPHIRFQQNHERGDHDAEILAHIVPYNGQRIARSHGTHQPPVARIAASPVEGQALVPSLASLTRAHKHAHRRARGREVTWRSAVFLGRPTDAIRADLLGISPLQAPDPQPEHRV